MNWQPPRRLADGDVLRDGTGSISALAMTSDDVAELGRRPRVPIGFRAPAPSLPVRPAHGSWLDAVGRWVAYTGPAR